MKSLLNYVWIGNKDHYDPARMTSRSPVPMDYLVNAFAVARAHPAATVWVWCDFETMSAGERKALEKTPGLPPNLSFMDLNKIKAYRLNPLFGKTRQKAKALVDGKTGEEVTRIWQKVDLARLLVIDQAFKTTKARDVFYSDFDVTNPQIDTPLAARALGDYGMVFSAFGGDVLENQFLGFRDTHKKAIAERLIPETEAGLRAGDTDGWWRFCQCVPGLCPAGQPKDVARFSFEIETLPPKRRNEFQDDLPSSKALRQTAKRSSPKTSSQPATYSFA